VEVSVNPSGLTSGTQSATLQFADPNATGSSPQSVQITFILNPKPVTPPTAVLTSLTIIPTQVTVSPNDPPVQFSYQAYDQNGNPMNLDPSLVSWSASNANLPSAEGQINSSGRYQPAASVTSTAPDVITVQTTGIPPARANVFYKNPGGFEIISITANPNPVKGKQTTVTVTAADSNPGAQLTYSWDTTVAGVNFSAPNSAQSLVTFSAPGVYTLSVKVYSNNFAGFPLSASVDVTVIRTITSLVIEPRSVLISPFQSLSSPFKPTVLDQFNLPMVGQVVDWSVPAGQSQKNGDQSLSFAPNGLSNTHVVLTAVSDANPEVFNKADVYISDGGGVGGPFDISRAHVYPVPWKSTGNVSYVTITGLGTQTEVKIYTADARLVWHNASINGEDLHWDIKNDNGERVASGVYLYRITNSSSGQTINGKLVVIQ
jgi:hypothetical protein